MIYISTRSGARRLLSASLALLLAAAAAAAQTPAAHATQGIVYFEEPLPMPPVVKPEPPLAPIPLPAPAALPVAAPVEATVTSCPDGSCGGGRLGGKCATCGRNANVPPPLGYHAHSLYALQAELARENFYVIEPWDWVDETDALGRGGELHLDAMVRKMGQDGSSIKIAPVRDAALNAARKSRLAAELSERGLADAATRVVMAPSTAEGLRSDEIEIIGGRILLGDGACRPCGYSPGGNLCAGGVPHP